MNRPPRLNENAAACRIAGETEISAWLKATGNDFLHEGHDERHGEEDEGDHLETFGMESRSAEFLRMPAQPAPSRLLWESCCVGSNAYALSEPFSERQFG